MRTRLRQTLRTLLRLPFEDHPAMTALDEAPHHCVAQAIDLVSYLRALHRADLFPVAGDDSTLSLTELGKRLKAVKRELRPIRACTECNFVGSRWSTQIDEVGRTMNGLLRGLTWDLKAYIDAMMSNAREAVIINNA